MGIEAKKTSENWYWYILKNGILFGEPLPIHLSSYYLIGRDRRIVDIPTDHPSCSGQHAILQYRCIKTTSIEHGTNDEIKPYILDLNSTNGTSLNGHKIEP